MNVRLRTDPSANLSIAANPPTNTALHFPDLARNSRMTDMPGSATWQDTVAKAVASIEQRTGLKLAGLSATEITQQVRDWMQAKKAGTLPAD